MKVLFLMPVVPYKSGQVAEVAEGYAKNFLIPKKLAVPATAQVIQQAQAQRSSQQKAVSQADQNLNELAQLLSNAILHIPAKAAPSGTLYAGLTPAHIAAAITKQFGHSLPPAVQETLPTLKRVGQYPIELQILSTTVNFTIDI